MGRILGLDFGLKRIGVAITDPLNIIASPLKTIETNDIFTYLENLIPTENISTIVVGLPLNLDLSDTHSTDDTKKFIDKLISTFPSINIRTIDERFTSKMASFTLSNMNLNKKTKRDKGNIDKISASLILQSYMSQL